MKLFAYCVSDRYPAGMPLCDSLSVLSAETADGSAAFGVLACARGKRWDAERAGATAVRDFARLFKDEILAGRTLCEDMPFLFTRITETEKVLQGKVKRYCREHEVCVSVDISIVMVIEAMCYGFCKGDVGVYRVDSHRAVDLIRFDAEDADNDTASENRLYPGMFTETIEEGSSILLCSPGFGRRKGKMAMEQLFFELHDPLCVRMRLKALTDAAARGKGAAGASAILICAKEEG